MEKDNLPEFSFIPCSVRLWSWISLFAQYKKRSAVAGLIEIENPNCVLNKDKKATEIDLDAAPHAVWQREVSVWSHTVCGEEVTLQQGAVALRL